MVRSYQATREANMEKTLAEAYSVEIGMLRLMRFDDALLGRCYEISSPEDPKKEYPSTMTQWYFSSDYEDCLHEFAKIVNKNIMEVM